MNINYIRGDATDPIVTTGDRVVALVCNDVGAYGAGFAKAVADRWPAAKRAYSTWKTDGAISFHLGATQFVPVEDGVHVANMLAQHGLRGPGNRKPLDPAALAKCLDILAFVASAFVADVSVHMPRIGCGLAGGTWDEVEPLIAAAFDGRDVPVYVYDL